MKVSEYLPYYGLLFNFEYQTGIEGKIMTVNEMFENYPDFELTDIHIDQLFYFDLHSLQTRLENNYFTPETVVSYLRELFDDFRQAGGKPFDWLQVTFESINLNPQSYKAELRATLEKTLIEWIEIYNKQPYDYLYYNTNPEALPPQKPETKTDKLKAPVIALFCSVLNDAGIIRKLETESVQTYCKRVCDVFKFTYKIRIGKAFYNSDNKANKDKIKSLILPLIDLEISKSVSNYLDNKQSIKQKLFV